MKHHWLRIIFLAAFLLGTLLPAGAAHANGGNETLTGWVTILWGDTAAGGTAMRTYLTTDQGESIPLELDETLTAPFGGLLALNKQRLTLRGSWMAAPAAGGTQTSFRVTGLDVDAAGSRSAPEAGVSGSAPWVSIMCKFSDYPTTEPKDLAYFQGMYASTYPGLDHYWREVSYNTANVAGSTAVGWYTLPQPRSYYVYNGALNFDRAARDCTAVADAAINFTNFVGINLMFNSDLDGYAWGGSQYMTLDGVSRVWSMTWEPPWGYEDITVMSHEMGHGFGLPHSSGNYGATYDNRWDVMSDTWSDCGRLSDPTYQCLGQHTISYHKDILGWIPANQKFTSTGGAQTITLEKLALPQTANYKMAEIPIGTNHFYTVEARYNTSLAADGYDVKLPGAGVIIHEVDTTRDRPARVIDIDLNGNTGDAGAIWSVGETFNDSANGISVYVASATSTGFVVTITTIGDGPAAFNKISPTNGATVGTSPSLTWGTSAGATSYDVCYDTTNNNACDDDPLNPNDGWQAASSPLALASLTEGLTYYWQVRANNDFGFTLANNGTWWNFKVAVTGPVSLEPGLPYPENTAINIHTRRPTFTWEPVSGATSYSLEVFTSNYCNTFTYTTLKATSAGTSYTPTADLAANTDFCWRVKANGAFGSSAYSQVRIFKTASPPTMPTLRTPAANALTSNLRPLFDWTNSSLPAGTLFDTYEFQLDTSGTFDTPNNSYTTTPGDLTDSDWTPTFDLARATTYYWRVRAWNQAGDSSAWTAARTLRISYETPILLAPANTLTLPNLTPTFTWNAVLGATSYKIQVSAYSNFRINVINATVTAPTYTRSSNLPARRTLYWRVQALGTYGPSAWSTTWMFKTP